MLKPRSTSPYAHLNPHPSPHPRPHPTLGHTFVQPQHQYFVHPAQLGVHQKSLSGTFFIPPGLELPDGSVTPDNHTLQGTLQLFLRAVVDVRNRRILLRGFAYWDHVHAPQLWANLKLETPQEFNKVCAMWWCAVVYCGGVLLSGVLLSCFNHNIVQHYQYITNTSQHTNCIITPIITPITTLTKAHQHTHPSHPHPSPHTQWVPSLSVGRTRTLSRKQTQLRVERAPDGTKPLSVFGQLPIQAAAGVQVLHVEDWQRTWPLREVLSTASPAADRSNSPPLFYTMVVRVGWGWYGCVDVGGVGGGGLVEYMCFICSTH